MKPEIQGFYIEKQADVEAIAKLMEEGWKTLPYYTEKWIFMIKEPEKKIATFKEK